MQAAYWDASGRLRRASPEAVRAVVEALGLEPGAPPRPVEPTVVAWDGRWQVSLKLPVVAPHAISCWLLLEDGTESAARPLRLREVRRVAGRVELQGTYPQRLPPGAHRAVLEVDGQVLETTVLSAPRRLPPVRPPGWGVWVPVYGLWSRELQVQADYVLLRRAAEWLHARGAGVLGTLPLFPSLLHEPFEPSPYLPASRLFWNELFVHVPGEGWDGGGQGLLDYRAAFEAKRTGLRQSWTDLPEAVKEHVRAWARRRPHLLQYAAFRAYLEEQSRPWRTWPEPARSGQLPEDLGEAAEVYVYAQWLASAQLADVAGSGTWLYLDLPLGVHPDGFDAWRFREQFVQGVSVGAPPDPFAASGQDWSFAPLNPLRAREDGYAYLRACLAHVFRVARMVRLDHVMALHRLYWIPRGFPATQGVYVRYPAEELYAAVLLEASRAGAVVVGEDLGTVPPSVRRELDRRGLWRMYVLVFEAESPTLREPPPNTVASLGTHDTPTFAAFWAGLDVDDRHRMGLLSREQAAAARLRRQQVVGSLARQLGVPASSPECALRAALRWLAESTAGCVLVHLEDLWGEVLAHNVPGTTADQHPNWRRRVRYAVEDWGRVQAVEELLRVVAHGRRTAG